VLLAVEVPPSVCPFDGEVSLVRAFNGRLLAMLWLLTGWSRRRSRRFPSRRSSADAVEPFPCLQTLPDACCRLPACRDLFALKIHQATSTRLRKARPPMSGRAYIESRSNQRGTACCDPALARSHRDAPSTCCSGLEATGSTNRIPDTLRNRQYLPHLSALQLPCLLSVASPLSKPAVIGLLWYIALSTGPHLSIAQQAPIIPRPCLLV
jgi:hypothetical protein